MSQGLLMSFYLIAALLFVMSLAGLSKQSSARQGNRYGIIGMVIAILATLAHAHLEGLTLVTLSMAIGIAIGLYFALKVQMTEMPQLVAILNGFGGLAAVLIGFSSAWEPAGSSIVETFVSTAEHTIHSVEIFVGIIIGAVTFSGSLVAAGKLHATISSRPFAMKGRHWVNLAMLGVAVLMGVIYVQQDSLFALVIMTLFALAFGVLLVLGIGGADMPVVVSMLNAYSGLAAAATGFMLSNNLLIITGAMVGSSGAILSYLMCSAMNRSFISVILGGFGENSSPQTGDEIQGEYKESDAEHVADILKEADNVIITPGYGMAVAQAQHAVRELITELGKRKVKVRFGIHPVAGRLPGHMNVLLAEAKVPYDIVEEMDEINDDFSNTDVVLVIGANDTVNPSATEDPSSPIAGMPVLKVWNARNVIVFKRSMATGYAGVQNPLFFKENSFMLFGDARESVDKIVKCL
ncbi:Re/Si-specific NAD(P)(+) transhydrogenase subunit beta [Endozoicomonas sp.]|nr:Re/Si-specific NAD(P)(+) transhydrogenase subunit beta [Endozoicomonas sp.]